MELPKGSNTKEGDSQTHVLKLLKNLYGKNMSRRVWNHHLNDELRYIGLKKSAIDKCVWYRENTILFYDVNDNIFMGSDSR